LERLFHPARETASELPGLQREPIDTVARVGLLRQGGNGMLVPLWQPVDLFEVPRLIGFCAARVAVCGAGARLWLYGFRFTRQLIPRQPLANDLPHCQIEALAIVESLAVVVAERLLIKVPEQVGRFN
jgi:hypothetical protein